MSLVSNISSIWQNIIGTKPPNPLDYYIMKMVGANAIYPDEKEETYLQSYLTNNDVFTVINKITEPASTVPIQQMDANGEEVTNGKMIARILEPNPYQSCSQFIEAALTFYYLFGNSYTAAESLTEGLNANMPARLDQLPPQWMEIKLGTMFNPVAGYSFYPMLAYAGGGIDYAKENVFHWKEFNPDYTYNGGHLKGMSRLRPLLKTITGSQESYNSLVKAFQAQGMWGILTMLDEGDKVKELTKEQRAKLRTQFRADSKRGDLTIANSKVEYTKMGLTIVELEVLKALGTFKGSIADAFNVPPPLLSGSPDRTYENYKVAERALWTNAICPSLDAYLEGLSKFLAPKFKENGNVLKADYSGVEALQVNVGELITWMVAAKSFTKNEIRQAAGYEPLESPGMNEVFDTALLVPVSELGSPPNPVLTESTMKALKLTDYRNAN
jgi:HK97 family phage portal protein